MTGLTLSGVEKSYRTQSVLRGVNLEVEEGSLVAVLGPSGSGKTTLLRLIAGFDRADAGAITLRGRMIDGPNQFVEPEQRRVGYVPQDGSLFPHLSVEDNVGFGLPRRHRRGERVRELLEMVGLAGLATRYPHQLSGGQQQRVALARGLMVEPELLLLDEPFSSLDATLRASLRHDVRRVLKESGTTALFVTHDQDEALSLADRVAIISDGVISQHDAPDAMYRFPRSPALALELGDANLFTGVAGDDGVVTPLGQLPLASAALATTPLTSGSPVTVLVRPEQIVVHNEVGHFARAEVLDTEFYGHDAVIALRLVDTQLCLRARAANPILLPSPTSEVGVEIVGPVMAWQGRNESSAL